MKTLLLLALAAAAGLAGVHAEDKAAATDPQAAPVSASLLHVVRTHRLGSIREKRAGIDAHGRSYTYHVTVVTYKDVYSNGTSRVYTRTFRA